MSELPTYVISPKNVLGKVSVMVGITGSGKTTMVRDFIAAIQYCIEQAFVISRTAMGNGDYDGIVPPACIHKELSTDFLKELGERQAAIRDLYDRANIAEVIDELFARVAGSSLVAKIAAIREMVDKSIEETGDACQDKIEKLIYTRDELITGLKKKTIAGAAAKLLNTDLTPEERHTLDHINLNPNCLLIFDDATSDIDKHKNSAALKEIFYASRHSNITVLMIVHTDKALLADLKKSAAFLLFFDRASASAFFERKSSDIDKRTLAKARQYIPAIIGTKTDPIPFRYQRLVYSDSAFYKYTASIHERRWILNSYLLRYCEEVMAHRGNGMAKNKYAKLLQ